MRTMPHGQDDQDPIFGMMEREIYLLEMIHVDVYSPVSIVVCGGYRYFPTFTDDLSRSTSLECLKSSNKIRVKFEIIVTRR